MSKRNKRSNNHYFKAKVNCGEDLLNQSRIIVERYAKSPEKLFERLEKYKQKAYDDRFDQSQGGEIQLKREL